MTIQRAINSGKPFRRKRWGKEFTKDWYHMKKARVAKHLYDFRMEYHVFLTLESILANDWEIKK